MLTCHTAHGRDCCQVGALEQGIFDPASYAKGAVCGLELPRGARNKKRGLYARATFLLFLVWKRYPDRGSVCGTDEHALVRGLSH
ncbi:MAG: hypothetical protein KJ069_26120 [Anaerolineae bacterium]|nr:hypothetical protein [Anaerolineae bacterium]